MSAIRFGDHLLDLDRGLLLCGDAPVHLRAKSFALLAYMAARPGRVLEKAALLDAVWPEVTVTEDSLTQAIRDVRKVLGEGAIRTVPRRGYVFEPTAKAEAAAPPRIAVLPLATLSPNPDDRLIADGLIEELTRGLGRFGQLSVVARHSAFQLRPESVPPEAAARRLGVRYFVAGTARRLGNRLTLGIALAATDDGRELWSETLELSSETLSQIAVGLPNRIAARLDIDVRRRIEASGAMTGSPDAYALFAAGVGLLRTYGPDVNTRGKALLERAIARDPGFALAHAYLGLAELMIAGYDLAPPEVIATGLAHVRRAIEIAPEEARCHWVAALIRHFAKDHAAAELHSAQAMTLNPSDADILMIHGYILALRGRGEEGLALMRRAEALNPLHPPWYHTDFAHVCQLMGRHEDVVARLGCLPVLSAFGEMQMAASLAALGDTAGARTHLDRAAELEPGWDPVREAESWREPERAEDRAAFVERVRRAVELSRWRPPATANR